ncbi:hypothetical protein GU243_11205 [Pseudarthrobacter psychrotolerans]|uniref:Uncharacterized protein n=1 Tax=Pseudarthrobacter psychrotolerans TaxID=2697569 RepID=A0A6P1NIP4_9MICC|nr:hypothetical protein [Pseudarthrobacter psychrotolerans]QHK20206.1 hypothetical protein GU243_11205 [Pseudarthrobacter psychrotolerans]
MRTTNETTFQTVPRQPGTLMARRKRVSWKHLPYGEQVDVVEGGQLLGPGTVDATTPDGSIVWVVIHGVGGRRMLHQNDDMQLEIIKPLDSAAELRTSPARRKG